MTASSPDTRIAEIRAEERTQFDYLLNAFEAASQSKEPAVHDYAGKRAALFEYVRNLEASIPDQIARAVEAERDHQWNGLDEFIDAMKQAMQDNDDMEIVSAAHGLYDALMPAAIRARGGEGL